MDEEVVHEDEMNTTNSDDSDENEQNSDLIEDLSTSTSGESESSSDSSSILSLNQSSMNQSWTQFQEQVHQLRHQLREKEDENTRLTRLQLTKQQEFEEKVMNLRQQCDLQLLKERQQFGQWQERTKKELRTFKTQMEIVKTQRPLYLKQLEQLKLNLSGDFEVTPERYIELKQRSVNQQGLKDWIQIRIYDTVYPYRKKYQKLELELRETRIAKDRLEMDTDELGQVRKKQSKELTSLRAMNGEMRKELENLTDQYSEKQHFYDQYRHKSNRIGEIETKSQDLEKKCFTLQNDLELKMKELHSTVAEQAGYRKQNEIQRQTIELLKQDKMYLTNEVSLLREQKIKMDDENKMRNTQVGELKTKRDDLFQQILSLKEGTKIEYEQRLQLELDKLQRDMKHDFSKMKAQHNDLFQRDHTQLQLHNQTLTREVQDLRTEVFTLKEKNQVLTDENKTIIVTSERNLNQTQTKLKMSNYELEKLNLLLAEIETRERHLKLENEKNMKKVEFLRTKIHELREKYHEEVTDLRSELTVKSRELDGYQKFEDDLDSGINAIGESLLLNNKTEEDLTKVISGVPTSHKRRLQYCLTLVKRISILERENSQYRSKIEGLEDVCRVQVGKMKKLEEKLRMTAQPYEYLVGNLEQKELELKRKARLLGGLGKTNRRLKGQVKKLLGVNKVLGRDLERLLGQGVEIQKIKRYFESNEPEKSGKVELGGNDIFIHEPEHIPDHHHSN